MTLSGWWGPKYFLVRTVLSRVTRPRTISDKPLSRTRLLGSVNSSSDELASGIDSGDYRRRRVPLHCFNCPALRLDDGRPGTCEPHPSPPRQVSSRNHVPVHYHSTL